MKTINKFLFTVILLVVSISAFALPIEGNVEFDILAALSYFFGEKAAPFIVTIGFIGYLWAQFRQLIPAKWLARLPDWLISLLEYSAANKGNASHEVYNDPGFHKRSQNIIGR